MAELLYRHQDGQNLAELRNYKLVQGQLFKINGKNHYRGVASYPVTPAVGDTWEELDATGLWIEGWVYTSPGRWVSVDTYRFFSISNGSTTFNSTISSPCYPLPASSNILFLNFILGGSQNTTATASNNYSWTFESLAAFVFSFASFNTFNPTVFTAGVWNTVVFPINQLFFPASQGRLLRVSESRNGNPTKVFSYIIEFKKVRL